MTTATTTHGAPTLGAFVARSFGWDDCTNIFPPKPTTPNDITPLLLQIACESVCGLYNDPRAAISAIFGGVCVRIGATYETAARYIRDNWDKQITTLNN